MPAPLAKGLILSLSLLFAAGAAVYENPQVRQWVDENRRKVAIALHNLGDELAPEPRRRSSDDASTREDETPEAVERRRHARQEILDRGRLMEERKRGARQAQGRALSFDDLVDKDGSLKKEEDLAMDAKTTATEPQPESVAGLRHRGTEALHAENPRSATPMLPLVSPPIPPKPAAYQSQRALIDMDESANPLSEHHIDQPITSPSSSATDDLAELNDSPASPSSSAADDSAELGQTSTNPQQGEMYMSVNEWAHNQSTQQSFHSSSDPESVSLSSRSSTPTLEHASVADSLEHASRAGTEDMDVMSEFSEGGINTPSTWTEVGSQVSDE